MIVRFAQERARSLLLLDLVIFYKDFTVCANI